MLIKNAIARTAVFVMIDSNDYAFAGDPTSEEKLHFNLKEEMSDSGVIYCTDLDSIEKAGNYYELYSDEEDCYFIICIYKYVINRAN